MINQEICKIRDLVKIVERDHKIVKTEIKIFNFHKDDKHQKISKLDAFIKGLLEIILKLW